MSGQITLSLPEEVLERAELLARRMGRPVNEFLAQTIALSLSPLGTTETAAKSLATCTDEEVLAAAEAQMSPEDDQRLSELLNRQQAGLLTSEERSELTALMEIYQTGLLRKAEALREAIRRGLREPLQS